MSFRKRKLRNQWKFSTINLHDHITKSCQEYYQAEMPVEKYQVDDILQEVITMHQFVIDGL